MAEPRQAKTEQPLTPAQAMYHVLACTGHVHQKVDFARMVGIHDRNIYGYLGDPDSDRPRGFIVSSIRKIHRWAHAICEQTGVKIEIRLLPDGHLVIIAEGSTKNGAPFGPMIYPTIYHRYPWGFSSAVDGDDHEGA